MKNIISKRRKLLYVISSFMMIGLLTGCNIEKEVVEKDTSTKTIQTNDIGIPSLTQTLSIKDEDFSLLVDYDICDYDLNKWRITDNKAVGMNVKTQNLPDGYEVSLDHVHADISLKSTEPQVNGITQDTMDDTYHGVDQDGFLINNDTEYYNIFSIEGYTEQFYKFWMYYNGTGGSNYIRLTEKDLIDSDVYAEKLSVVYDVAIKKPNANRRYVKSVKSEILIPVSKNIKTKKIY